MARGLWVVAGVFGVLFALACGGSSGFVEPVSSDSTVVVERGASAVDAAAPTPAPAGRDCYGEDVTCKSRCADVSQSCSSGCDDGVSGPCNTGCDEARYSCEGRCDTARWACEG